MVGPWSGNLSAAVSGVHLEDAAGNPADEVRYAGGGRWPEASDGGGSSLELRDASADNSAGGVGREQRTDRADWQTFTWSGPNVPSQAGEPTLWRELNLLLVDGPGECLIDDVRVTDMTTNANLIQNGDFSAGAAHWRFLGNHRTSRVEPEPGNPGNSVLHLIASGPGEYQGNQIESTFLGNQALVANRVYEVSMRVRWLSGGARLNTRLYFNRLPHTHVLAIAPNGGTPGTANSQGGVNLGPTYTHLRHEPVVPEVNQPVTISVAAADPGGVANVVVKYAVSPGAFQSTPMTATGSGNYRAILPDSRQARWCSFISKRRINPGRSAPFQRAVRHRGRALCGAGWAGAGHTAAVSSRDDAGRCHLHAHAGQYAQQRVPRRNSDRE